MSCIIYLVRHGQSIDNRDDIFAGHHDTPLTELGREQAEHTKELLKDVHFDAAYSSNLLRASQTADIIFGKALPEQDQLPDLRERTAGALDGVLRDSAWNEINKQYEAKYGDLPLQERWNYSFGEGIEGDKLVYERFSNTLLKLAQDHQGQTILVATHGGPIRITLMKLGYASLLTSGAFKNAGYVELISDGKDFQLGKVVGVDINSTAA